MRVQPGCSLFQIILTCDVVPVEYGPGLMPRDPHGYYLGDPCPDHISYCGTPQIVKEPALESGFLAGVIPGAPEVSNLSSLPVKNIGATKAPAGMLGLE